MSKEALLFSIVELVVLLIPIVAVIAKFSSWKKEVEIKVAFLEANDSKQDAYYQEVLHAIQAINVTLARIEERTLTIEKLRNTGRRGNPNDSKNNQQSI